MNKKGSPKDRARQEGTRLEKGAPQHTSWMSFLNKRLVCFDLHQELLKRVWGTLTGQVRPIISQLSVSPSLKRAAYIYDYF